MKRVLFLVAALVPLTGHAEVFRCMDASGKVTYSLTRPAGPCHAQRGQARPVVASKSPEEFPRVDTDTQRRRDDKRRQILEAELQTEMDLQQAANGQEEAAHHERNISALRREIARL